LTPLERHDALHPTALDLAIAPRLESELDEEFDRGREIVDHDPNVFHPLDRHALDGREAGFTVRWRRTPNAR